MSNQKVNHHIQVKMEINLIKIEDQAEKSVPCCGKEVSQLLKDITAPLEDVISKLEG